MAKSALFVWGGWDGHQPRQCVDVIAPLIDATGLHVEISDSLDAFDDLEALKKHAVIVPCWTMGELGYEREQAVVRAVASGVGIAGWHGGMGDAFRGATDYQFMTGGQFVAHPGDIVDYRVQIVAHDHPITQGLTDFDVHSEQYYMHIDPTNEVLAMTTATDEHAPQVAGSRMPVAWIRRWGEGRVFYCSIGHSPDDLRIPQVNEMIRRGILWAAGALVEKEVLA